MSDDPLGLQGRPYPYHVDTTADHWWPKGLQRLWADHEGYVSRVRPSGEQDRKKAPQNRSKKGFGQKRGGHRIVFGVSPWNHTFEPEFDDIDSSAPPVLKSIAEASLGQEQALFIASAATKTVDILTKLCFSLLIRSPAFRDLYSRAGEAYGYGNNAETGKVNIAQFWGLAKGIDLANCNTGKRYFCTQTTLSFVLATACTIQSLPVR